MAETVEIKIPRTLGLCADRLYSLAEEKRALMKKVEALEKEESVLKSHLIDNISKQDSTGVRGQRAQVKIVVKEVPTVNTEAGGWEQLYLFIKRKNAFHLLQRRLATSAVNEMLADGVKIPGVAIFNAVTVSVTKL